MTGLKNLIKALNEANSGNIKSPIFAGVDDLTLSISDKPLYISDSISVCFNNIDIDNIMLVSGNLGCFGTFNIKPNASVYIMPTATITLYSFTL